jgi:hypothetical protein
MPTKWEKTLQVFGEHIIFYIFSPLRLRFVPAGTSCGFEYHCYQVPRPTKSLQIFVRWCQDQ